jgi:hypothetical protein
MARTCRLVRRPLPGGLIDNPELSLGSFAGLLAAPAEAAGGMGIRILGPAFAAKCQDAVESTRPYSGNSAYPGSNTVSANSATIYPKMKAHGLLEQGGNRYAYCFAE